MSGLEILSVIWDFLQVAAHRTWNLFLDHPVLWIMLLLLAMMYLKSLRDKKIEITKSESKYSKIVLDSLEKYIKGYRPTFWLPFSVLKNIWQGDKQIKDMSVYHRKLFTMFDGEVLAADFYPNNFDQLDSEVPIVFFVPGVFGMSNDSHSLEFCKILYKRAGWRSCVFNRRGYGGMPIKGTRVLGLTSYDDMHEVIKQISVMLPKTNIYLVGVSLGAANSQRYLADFSEEHIVKAAVSISSPWNAHIVTDKIKKNPFLRKGIHSYQKKLFKEQLAHQSFNELLKSKNICPQQVLKTTDNQHFDDVCSSIGLDLKVKEEYYDALSTHHLVHEIKIPMLSINSSDDLLIPVNVIPLGEIKDNPHIVHLQVTGAGHTEYFHGCKAEYVS